MATSNHFFAFANKKSILSTTGICGPADHGDPTTALLLEHKLYISYIMVHFTGSYSDCPQFRKVRYHFKQEATEAHNSSLC